MIKQFKPISLPHNIDAPLCRYLSHLKLKSLLEKKSIYFCRADLFSDSLEGTLSTPTILNRPEFFEGATDHWINVTMPLMDSQTRKCVYASCWHNNETESPKMWHKYSDMGKGLMIKSSLNRIRNSIQDIETEFLVNPVRYINHKKDYISDANSFYAFFHKSKLFEYERELRFALIKNFEKIGQPNFDSTVLEKGIFVPVDTNLLIEKIVLNPEAPDEIKAETYVLLKKHKLTDRLERSSTGFF